MINHKQCIAIIAIIALIAGGFFYRHQMMCKQDDVQIQGHPTTTSATCAHLGTSCNTIPCCEGYCVQSGPCPASGCLYKCSTSNISAD